MMSEIFVEGKKLDINANISSLLTFAIDDIKNFATRSTVFSKTVVLPGTANNNKVFGHIFETGLSNSYDPALPNIGINFNPAKSANCIIFQDNLQTFKGTIRLIEIIRDKGRIEYETALNGELTSLNVALSSAYLTDLDFSEYSILWNMENIAASWDNTPGSGVYFPLIDYGTYSTDKHNWDFRTFRPALYVKEYLDKIFTAADFRYDCDLFETDRFKRLVIPHNQKRLVSLTSQVLSGTNTTDQHVIDHLMGPNGDSISFGAVTGGLFTTSLGKYYKYIGTDTISTTVNIVVQGYYNLTSEDAFPFQVKLGFQKNDLPYYTDPDRLDINSGNNEFFYREYSIPIILATDDVINFYFLLELGEIGTADVFVTEASISLASASVLTAPVDYNEEINLLYAIPQNIRQVDFLVSIVQLFNLYIYEDRFDDRLIHITPFVDFYSAGSGSSVDWTYKLNRDKPVKIKPLSEVNSKIYKFNFRDDSDYYNDLYKKRYNQGYGSHVFDSEFEFASQENKLELIFAPTPLVGYIGEDKVYPTIFKRTGSDEEPVEENVDSVIRIMQTKKIQTVSSWAMKNRATPIGNLTSYGYAGHFDDPTDPNDDLNFGLLKELFYTLSSGDLTKTQFNIYWSPYMAEITDKDSKMVVGKFYLTAKDIFTLDFSVFVFVDGVLYRLNKIIDYNATVPGECTVELLKVINTAYSFPPGQIPEEFSLLWNDGEELLYDDDLEILYK